MLGKKVKYLFCSFLLCSVFMQGGHGDFQEVCSVSVWGMPPVAQAPRGCSELRLVAVSGSPSNCNNRALWICQKSLLVWTVIFHGHGHKAIDASKRERVCLRRWDEGTVWWQRLIRNGFKASWDEEWLWKSLNYSKGGWLIFLSTDWIFFRLLHKYIKLPILNN